MNGNVPMLTREMAQAILDKAAAIPVEAIAALEALASNPCVCVPVGQVEALEKALQRIADYDVPDAREMIAIAKRAPPVEQEPIGFIRLMDGEPDWAEDCLHSNASSAADDVENLNADWAEHGDEKPYSYAPIYLHPSVPVGQEPVAWMSHNQEQPFTMTAAWKKHLMESDPEGNRDYCDMHSIPLYLHPSVPVGGEAVARMERAPPPGEGGG